MHRNVGDRRGDCSCDEDERFNEDKMASTTVHVYLKKFKIYL